ncbi:F-box domain-containing protein [Mycena sanguinolenta]|uniref:F-box domain-containing protein n=1 Tax=Mycena sanguinolenta TaxID=230812 RepID=A0A8H6ZCW9_9AGAR|nr:F-box domain-containing protein [Mycena sanguinolenta]
MLESMKADRLRLTYLVAQIRDLERLLSALRKERAQTQKRLSAYKYPVLTLPNEITSEIFIHFLPVYPDAPPLVGLELPTTLTHVCHHWREVALATPALWRALKFSDVDNSESYKLIHRISDAWIRRSRSCLLSIDIDIVDPGIFDEIFAETLAAAATRWEHLRIYIPRDSHPKIGRMPLLRSLDLEFEGRDRAVKYDAPKLRTVVLWSGVQNVTLPWARITCLTMNKVGLDQCASILRHTTHLIQYILLPARYLQPHGLLNFPGSHLTLPCLQSLTSESLTLGTRSRQLDSFLSALVVPAFRRLDLQRGIPRC